ncbi:unnamed protein product [Heligmosomoides polygyrus]|uniref:Uncharacterized protein n=1 Tax=Heligmosomoides polygyrus TaxID=6339 RepID=A0A183FGG2_HELPZ|nr:unnamed protein product [Heligmosomoides polygyrus]
MESLTARWHCGAQQSSTDSCCFDDDGDDGDDDQASEFRLITSWLQLEEDLSAPTGPPDDKATSSLPAPWFSGGGAVPVLPRTCCLEVPVMHLESFPDGPQIGDELPYPESID